MSDEEVQHPKPDWKIWSRVLKAELWKVVAVSCDIVPGALVGSTPLGESEEFSLDGARNDGLILSFHPQEFSQRLLVAESHLGGLDPVWWTPPLRKMGVER